jgi:UDP-GlcNAc:undecaprenyl-phosphate/decaprenyl-phosphate GlcNAc-1-phosphate transferase
MTAGSFFIIALSVGAFTPALIVSALMGALVGFLRYNWPPARIYLGDSGSLFIGGVLAAVSFMIPWGTFSRYGFITPVIILAIPLLEEGTLIVIRTYYHIPFYRGSPHHFSHFLRANGWPQRTILLYVTASSLILWAIALLYFFNVITLKNLIGIMVSFTFMWYITLLFRLKKS